MSSELTPDELAGFFPRDNCGSVVLLEDEWREVLAHIDALTARNGELQASLTIAEEMRNDALLTLETFSEFTGDDDLWAVLKQERDAALAAVAAITAERDAAKQSFANLVYDECEDDMKIREIAKEVIPAETVDGSPDGVPGVIDIVELLANEVSRVTVDSAEAHELLRLLTNESQHLPALRDMLRRVHEQAGNGAPDHKRHALTPGLRDEIQEALERKAVSE